MSQEGGFENKRVVIVCGSSGIWVRSRRRRGIAGGDVVIASSNAERVQEVIQSSGGGAWTHGVGPCSRFAVRETGAIRIKLAAA